MRCSWRRFCSAALLALAWGARAHEGWGVAVHERHGVVVADIPSNTIWRFKDGRVDALVRGVHSHALIAAGDAIYGTSEDSVWRVDAAGRFSHVLPPDPRSPMGFQSFLIRRDGSIYSASRYDYRRPAVNLLRRAPDGTITTLAKGFRGIDGMREHGAEVLVADSAYLRAVAPDGGVRTVAGPLTERRFDEDLLGLSTVRDGIVHTADLAGRRVLRVDLQSGRSEVVHRSSFFWAPSGVEPPYVLEHLRPPLALLGDMQLGPYLRVIRMGEDPETVGVVWGRRTGTAVAVVIAVSAVVGVLWLRRRSRSREV